VGWFARRRGSYRRAVARIRSFLALGIVSALAFPVSGAHATTVLPERSCVDLNNDGVCGPTDPDLAPILNATDGQFDTTVASPGYTPPGTCCVGVIFDNFATNNDSLDIFATGDVRVFGAMKAKHIADLDIETPQDVFIADRASLALGGGRCCLSSITIYSHELTFGAKSQVKAGGEDSFWDIETKNIYFGDGAKLNIKGADASAFILASNKLFFGLNNQFVAPSSGEIDLLDYQTIAATGLKVIAGTIDMEAQPPDDGHIPGREIDLTNSLINQIGIDGSLTMLAGDTSAPKDTDRIVLVNTHVLSRSGDVDIEPTPTSP
jgi:hypothetical protein